MQSIGKKSFSSPDETMNPAEDVKIDIVDFGGAKVQRITALPGWRWSTSLKPVVKTETCEKDHLIYMISGTLASKMNDGAELEFGPGEIGTIPPGHDGWTAGEEAAVWLELPH